jgi:hypothetical protein
VGKGPENFCGNPKYVKKIKMDAKILEALKEFV